MKKGIVSIVWFTGLLAFISCESQNSKDSVETRTISIDVSESHHNLLDKLVDDNKKGQITFYQDEQRTKAYENFMEDLGMKEIIQVPSVDHPGEFIDSIISIQFKTESFSKMTFTGIFTNGKLTDISAFSAEHKLMVDGQDLGDYPAFYLDPAEIAKTELIDDLSGLPELNNSKIK